jgi:hypothetical protein
LPAFVFVCGNEQLVLAAEKDRWYLSTSTVVIEKGSQHTVMSDVLAE